MSCRSSSGIRAFDTTQLQPVSRALERFSDAEGLITAMMPMSRTRGSARRSWITLVEMSPRHASIITTSGRIATANFTATSGFTIVTASASSARYSQSLCSSGSVAVTTSTCVIRDSAFCLLSSEFCLLPPYRRHGAVVHQTILDTLEAQPQRHQHHAEEDRVRTDDPDDRERAKAGPGDEDHTEGDRGDAGETHPELPFDLLAQPDRRNQLEDAGGDRPDGDQVQQTDRGQPRKEERHRGDAKADRAFKGQHPPWPPARTREGARNGENAVGERVGAPEDDERAKRYTRPDKRQRTEEHGADAAQHHRPPVLRHRPQHRLLLRPFGLRHPVPGRPPHGRPYGCGSVDARVSGPGISSQPTCQRRPMRRRSSPGVLRGKRDRHVHRTTFGHGLSWRRV